MTRHHLEITALHPRSAHYKNFSRDFKGRRVRILQGTFYPLDDPIMHTPSLDNGDKRRRLFNGNVQVIDDRPESYIAGVSTVYGALIEPRP